LLSEETHSSLKGKDWTGLHYIGVISQESLAKAEIHKEAFDEFVFVDKTDTIYPLDSQKDPKNSIVLFNDQYEVIKKLWK
jgi:hypothetical protein